MGLVNHRNHDCSVFGFEARQRWDVIGYSFSMEMTIDLRPDVRAALAKQAAARGMDVQSYAASLLEQAAEPDNPGLRRTDDLEKALDRIAQFSHAIPVLPDEASSRQSLYQDHD